MFSRSFLNSTGQHTGWKPFSRGTVKQLHDLHSLILADVDWGGVHGVQRVNVKNLVHTNRLHLEPA